MVNYDHPVIKFCEDEFDKLDKLAEDEIAVFESLGIDKEVMEYIVARYRTRDLRGITDQEGGITVGMAIAWFSGFVIGRRFENRLVGETILERE